MGIVGTREGHRRRGLMRRLSQEFDRALVDRGFDLAVIQGIAGFYDRFGYRYALPLENHVNLPLHLVPDPPGGPDRGFRQAGVEDIPFLLEQDAAYRGGFGIASRREEPEWRYLLTDGRLSGHGSQFWIGEDPDTGGRWYARIPEKGFGTGLILSEISEGIDRSGLARVLALAGRLAAERGKPYLRLNLHNDAAPARLSVALGASPGRPYAWQVKLPDPVAFLRRIGPALEQRLAASPVSGYSGRLRLDLYRDGIDLEWDRGVLTGVAAASGDCHDRLAVPVDLLAPLVLGYRSWQELQHVRPDLVPRSGVAGLLADALFPPQRAWIYQQY
jgi:hypothetical protein